MYSVFSAEYLAKKKPRGWRTKQKCFLTFRIFCRVLCVCVRGWGITKLHLGDLLDSEFWALLIMGEISNGRKDKDQPES